MIKKQTPQQYGRTARARSGAEKRGIFNTLRHNPRPVKSIDFYTANKALDRINAALNTIIAVEIVAFCGFIVALFGGVV
jgi:hypothetical protein